MIDSTNEKLPLVIKLNNGEILNDNVYITLLNTATLKDTPIAWSITEGSLKETEPSTVTNADGTTTTVTKEVITYNLTLTLFDSKYGVSVSDVNLGWYINLWFCKNIGWNCYDLSFQFEDQ